jgi:release factor glutamine methyltransferase
MTAAGTTWRELAAEADAELGNRQETRWLLLRISCLSPADLLSRMDEVAPAADAEQFRALVTRRQSGEPLQWVLGRWGFRTLEVLVDERALVPRPETELLVELALAELRRVGPPFLAADLGTGSGVVALALASECPTVRVVATDISDLALALAEDNLACQDPHVRDRVELTSGDWFGALSPTGVGSFAVIASNPPYLAAGEWPGLDPVVRDYDPYDALVAGETGLEAVGHLVAEAPEWLRHDGALVIEVAPHQRDAALALVSAAGAYASAEVVDDLAGRPRVLIGRRS